MFREVDFKIAIVSGIITFLGVLLVYFAFAQAAPAGEGITFPVAELGNCADEKACRAYCEEPANMPACIKFAEEHGLMNKTEAERAKKFSRVLGSGGPGGCSTPDGCKTFCSDVSNLDACLKWADQNNFEDEHFKEAQKIQSYLTSGGKMPGSCTSKESCMSYCGDFSHAEECFNFAKTAGLAQEPPGGGPSRIGRPGEGIPSEEQFKKLQELFARGETPGGCKSRETCEAYCEGGEHFEECIAFGEKVGFVKPDEARKIRELGGKGPGGCSSPRACEAYCNDPAHQEECFKFGEEHGLIPKEELEQAKQGFVRLRAGIEQAPPEVAECLKTTVGPTIIEDIQSGKLTPGPAIGERVRGCFERFGARHNPQEMFKNAPPQTVSCLKEKFGDKFTELQSGKAELTPETGDAFRVCFQEMRLEGGPGQGEVSPEGLQGFLRSAPPGVAECLKTKLGDDFQRIEAGGFEPTPDIGEKIKSCFQEFKPGEQMMMKPEMGQQFEGLRILENAPPEVIACLKNTLGEDVLQRVRSGELPGSLIAEKMKACFGRDIPQAPSPPIFTGGGSPSFGPPPIGPRFSETAALCMKQRLSEDQVRALQSGSEPTADVEAAIRECYSQLQSPGGTLPSLKPIFDQPQGTFTEPIQGTSEDPTLRCTSAGGKWTGSTCEFPTQPPPGASLLETLFAPFLNFLGR